MPPPEVDVFSRIGGDPAADLINTVHWRLDESRRNDKLRSFDDAVLWAAESGTPGIRAATEQTAGSDGEERAALTRIAQFREDLYAALINHDADAANRVFTATADALYSSRAFHDGHTWAQVFGPSPESLVHRIVHHTSALLTDKEHAPLIKQCADDSCGWVFLDTSPRHNRRWCSSADCGNRNRVRAHTLRSRAL